MSENQSDASQQEPEKEHQPDQQTINADLSGGARDTVIGANASINYQGVPFEQFLKAFDKQNEAHRKQIEHLFGIIGRFQGSGGKAVNVGRAFSEVFTSEQEQVSTENETEAAAASVEEVAELPNTLEGLEEWYYDALNEYERCFVQALAVLYGAPLGDISDATRKLYKVGAKDSTETLSFKRRELLRHVSATTRRVNMVDRTFWRNRDVQAQQDFTLRLLHFLAEETALTINDSRFADILCEWAETLSGECSRKAAYAVGVLLYYQSADELWRKANAWADSNFAKTRHLAASALLGAYDVDKLESPERADDAQKSPVFRLLNQWVERAENARNPRVGSAAANTYRLMSRKVPDIALAGIESLLCFPESRASSDWESISVGVWVECISAYIGIAWSGQIRKVLAHLARYAKMLLIHQHRPKQTDEREAYDNRRKLNLGAVLDIFFFTALSSLGSVQENGAIHYDLTDPLPEPLELLDEQGRDILLAGILSSREARWRSNLLLLLCAAIFAEREREAFFFLGQWADIIHKFVEGQDEALEIYAQFLVTLGTITRTWEDELRSRNLRSRPAYQIFERQLNLLKGQTNRIPLIEHVLDALPI